MIIRMKKNLTFLMAIVLVGMMVSCTKDYIDDVSVQNSPQKIEKFLWEHQLDYAMEHNTVADYPLKMLGYKYKGIISNETDIVEYLDFAFSSNSYLAIDSYRNKERFEVFKRQEIIAGCVAQGLDVAEQFEKQRKQVANYITIGKTHVVEIHWNYNGVDFSTWALVEEGNKGVIYDNVASVARCPRPNAEVVWKKYVQDDAFQVVSYTRSDDESQGRILKQEFYKSDHHEDKNFMGRYLWEYEIKCVSKFSEAAGVYMGTEEFFARASYESNWCCDAEIMTVSGEPMSTSSHTFKWAYTYGVGSVSVSIAGFGFTFNGSGTNMQGQECHSIDSCPTA